MDEFSAAHFAFHPFTLMGGLPQAVRVFGGEARLEALLASLNAAVFAPGGIDGATPRQASDEQPSVH